MTRTETRAELRRLAEAATPGPCMIAVAPQNGPIPIPHEQAVANARLFTAAREALPVLLSQVETLRKALTAIEHGLQDSLDRIASDLLVLDALDLCHALDLCRRALASTEDKP